jgi:hypothetical protein
MAIAADLPGSPTATVSSGGYAKMAQNPFLPAALASAALALLPLHLISEAQELADAKAKGLQGNRNREHALRVIQDR